MTYMSPLLKSKLNIQDNQINKKNITVTNSVKKHDQIYENLTRHANSVHPNEAKAKLIKENVVQGSISSVKDLGQDMLDLRKAVKTGKMSDSRLGRMNDLGMKLGTVLISTLLAIHSKTKSEAIMRFVGGGMFLGAMKLWPKLFINLPNKARFGFDIGQKYVTAQGDKKEFFLDNQFLPWDAYSKEEIDKIGRKMGIDPNGKNAQEKIQRKMQKVALQNRTLWMATAGFATPLMTALTCNRIEPHLKNAIIDSGVRKAKKVFKNDEALNNYLSSVKGDLKRQEELERIIDVYRQSTPDNGFYKQISELLSVDDLYKDFLNQDDLNLLKNSNREGVEKALRELAEQYKTNDVDVNELQNFLKNIKGEELQATLKNAGSVLNQEDLDIVLKQLNDASTKRDFVKALKSKGIDALKIKELAEKMTENGEFKFSSEKLKLSLAEIKEVTLSDAQIKDIIQKVKENPTLDNLKELLKQNGIGNVPDKDFLPVLKANLGEFYDKIIEFNKTDLSSSRAKLKAYIKALNPLVGSKEEALSTRLYDQNMNELFKTLGIDYDELKEIAKLSDQELVEKVSTFFKNAPEDNDGYKEFLQKLMGKTFKEDEMGAIDFALKDENITKIKTQKTFPELMDAIFGSKGIQGRLNDMGQIETENAPLIKQGSILSSIKESILAKKADVDASRLKAILCANFERRLKQGDLKALNEADVELARNMIYNSSLSLRVNGGYKLNVKFQGGRLIDDIAPKLFDVNQFAQEKELFPEIEQFVTTLKDVAVNKQNDISTVRKYITSSGFIESVKSHATKLFNNKVWLKTFAPMALILVAVTFLSQAFFGNIKKEFPKEGSAK